MQNQYFTKATTLLKIMDDYPDTIKVFMANGFPQMEDPEKRKTFGANITLETALNFRQIDFDGFAKLLVDTIEQVENNVEANEKKKVNSEDKLVVKGLLPCPIRIPMTEQFEQFIGTLEEKEKVNVEYELQAASMGVDWLQNEWGEKATEDTIADIYMSAGFDMFFDERKVGRFKKQNAFQDLSGFTKLNKDFDNDYIDLKDPQGDYSILAVVPSVFLVNKNELKGRAVPRSWEDILKPEFERSVSLPIGDFDLFNAILLCLYKLYGEEALVKLGRSLQQDMHPSQMVKSDRKKGEKPAVTIMPYFFTKMVREGGIMDAVWPEDGAIISPIFMLTKKKKKEKLQGVADFLCSKEVGELLSHQGLFPSTHPDVDNRIPEDRKYLWPGWEFIYNNDIQALVKSCEEAFHKGVDDKK